MNLLNRFLWMLLLVLSSNNLRAADVQPGVSKVLAEERAKTVSDIHYALTFDIHATKDQPVRFTEIIRFTWSGQEDLQIDFQGTEDQLEKVIGVNGKGAKTVLMDEHVVIKKKLLREGENIIEINGTSGDKALNRSDDYLYTLFVPDHARSVFPCFDQPNLKAQFSVKLNLPEGWTSITNQTQKPLPTYLFSFVAGKFQTQKATRDGRELTALYRETDPAKVAQLNTVFDQVALSLRWMEQYTNIRYPFDQFGFVVLPGYQFGGMEHPGCIQFTDQRIFLGPQPTPDEELNRLNLIAHETSHMWFGDLVTMRWFDDVWTKEVFANFLADKIAREQFPNINHDLAFLRAHYPAALSTDRTEGTHPIQQPLENLNQASLLYGNIIYHKAPIMMQQLEMTLGVDALRKGLQNYLRKFAYSNATWDDLIAELDNAAPGHGVAAFSEAWVKEKGLPTISYEQQKNGGIIIRQSDPYHRHLTWRQGFEMGVVSEDLRQPEGYRTDDIDLYLVADSVSIPPVGAATASKRQPLVIPNLNGKGYGRFTVDDNTLLFLGFTCQTEHDPVRRQAALMTIYENYLMGNTTTQWLFGTLLTYLAQEEQPLVAASVCNYLARALADISDDQRDFAEYSLMNLARQHSLPSVRQQLLRLLGGVARSRSIVDDLYKIWNAKSESLLNDRDYTAMSYHLALMRPLEWQQILTTQRNRLKTDDERREFDYVSRACNPDEQVQQQLFNDLLKAENRRVEPWARRMLALLNDPTREPLSNRYLAPGLNALEDVQRTGDIFFPDDWLSGLLSGHRSDEAKSTVRTWISTHPTLSPALMNKLKDNAYWLLRK
ncbi:MAG: aminopeptidase [Prevotella sp.]|nr:aminopeptidase [Prevotella sp.]